MDLISLITGITGLLSLFCAGGWFINYRQKKAIEIALSEKAQTDANSDKVDLTDKILEKYQKSILDTMGGHDARHDAQDARMDKIQTNLSEISEYLNGGFSDFQRIKRDGKGRFIKL
jgi:hypothetical protein